MLAADDEAFARPFLGAKRKARGKASPAHREKERPRFRQVFKYFKGQRPSICGHDGVIIKRTIDLGQTVAASFTTPNLFQIARDLTKMQIDTSVSEADVGALKDGQEARFVVDAYPNREFKATTRQFRLAPNVLQNVVTYNVVLNVENQDELLKPGMTAQVRLVVGNRQNVLRIPTAALRFRLSDEELEKEEKKLKAKEGDKKVAEAVVPAPDADDDVNFHSKNETARSFKIFKLDDKNQAKPLDIKIPYIDARGAKRKRSPIRSPNKYLDHSPINCVISEWT